MLQEKIHVYKKLMLLFFSLISFYCNSQTVDTITRKINFVEYNDIMKQNIKERSNYTLENKEEIQRICANDSVKLLLNYPIDTLYVVTSMPIFELKKNVVNNNKVNILKKINFSNNFHNQFSNIYYNDEIVFESIFIDQDSLSKHMAIISNSLILNSFDDHIRFGHLKGFLMKLELDRKYFTFFIQDCPLDHLFIVDSGIVYAVFNPRPNGSYEKMEINDYFLKKYNKNFIYNKKRLLRKRFKEKYFFKN
jgi:hypothetical protein